MTKKNRIGGFVSFLVVLAMLTVTSSVALAFSGKNAMGEISVLGNSDGNGSFVVLNGEKAYNGRTFISNGTIETKEAGATVKLGDLGSVSLAPNTTLNLSISDATISGNLAKGKINVTSKENVKVDIATVDNKVSNDGVAASRFSVSVISGQTQTFATQGNVVSANGAVKQDDDDDDDDDPSVIPLFLVFAGVVGGVTALVLLNRDDDELNTQSGPF